jgi:RNA polymerase sigma factor for flagellar operon FliA
MSTTCDTSELVTSHLHLVSAALSRIRWRVPQHVDLKDLESAGAVGLMEAARKYEADDSRKFSGYAMHRIYGAMIDELRRQDWYPRRTRQLIKQFDQKVEEMERARGCPPTREEVREALGWTERQLDQVIGFRTRVVVRLDSNTEEGTQLHEVMKDESAIPAYTSMEMEETLRILTDKLDSLPDIQRKVVAMYYFEGMTLAEIGKVFHITASRVQQIRTQVVDYLRSYLIKAACR